MSCRVHGFSVCDTPNAFYNFIDRHVLGEMAGTAVGEGTGSAAVADGPPPAHELVHIRDVQGRLLKLIRADFGAGIHQIDLGKEELPATGVLYYTLETRDFVATKKMVLVE